MMLCINFLLLPSITNPSTGENYFHFNPPAKPSFKQPYKVPTPHQAQRNAHPWGEKTKEFPPEFECFSKPQKPKFIKPNEILKVFLGNRTEKPSVKFHSKNYFFKIREPGIRLDLSLDRVQKYCKCRNFRYIMKKKKKKRKKQF